MDATEVCGLLDADLVTFIHNIIVLLKIAVPIVLIVLGMIDFFKSVAAGKEDEIKKGQQVFIKRLISGALVFFVVTIVQLVMGIVSKEDDSFWNCANQIMNGTAGTKYEPTGVTGNKNNSNNENNNNNNNNSNANNQKEELPPSAQQQIDESYQGEGARNDSNVPNGGYSTSTTTTTTNPDYNPSSNSNNNNESNYQGQGSTNNSIVPNGGYSTSTTTTTTN